MQEHHFKKILFLILCLLVVISGCEKKQDSPEPPPSLHIELGPLQNSEGCLNIASYFDKLLDLGEATSIFEVTTSIEFSSTDLIRENFKRAVALGTLAASRRPLRQIPEIRRAQQEGCRNLNLHTASGEFEKYKINSATDSMIRAQNDRGEILEFRWLSPFSMGISSRYLANDAPCTEAKIYVQYHKTLDWSAQSPEFLEPGSVWWIDPDYLDLVSQATGQDLSQLYVQGPDSKGELTAKISVARLLAFLTAPPLPGLLNCADARRPPTPPEENEGTTTTTTSTTSTTVPTE